MIQRLLLERQVRRALKNFQVVLLSGPRQCGKTTLAKQIVARSRAEYFDLEDSRQRRRLSEPMEALERLRGLVVIDEVQHQPELFPLMRVLADRTPLPARFLLLGSASGTLLNRSSESLAGRVAYVEMGGFGLSEVLSQEGQEPDVMRRLWWRGRFPRAFWLPMIQRAESGRSTSSEFRGTRPATTRNPDARNDVAPVLMMVAHYHGQIWNASEIAGSLGESPPTTRRA